MARQGSLFRLTITVIIILIVSLYTVFNTRLLIKGPEITLYDLKNGQKVEEDLVTIKGEADAISFLSLNGRQIFIDENKMFEERVLLTNRINKMEIYAEDKFGKTDMEKFILVKDKR